MRIVFVDNILIDRTRPGKPYDLQPHLGLLSLIGACEDAGIEGLLFDPKLSLAAGNLSLDASLYPAMGSRILEMDPDVVGFTSLGANFICTLQVAAYVKRNRPLTPVLLGGPHATILHREILSQFPVFDVIVRHEAEETIVPILRNLASNELASIGGISYREHDRIVVNDGSPTVADLDALPWPRYDRYPIESLRPTSLRIEAGRGCPFSCTFCSTASFFGRKYRLKSPERLRSEMLYLRNTYGVTHFDLMHDLFTVNRRKVLDFCETISDLELTWSCSARMDCVDEAMLNTMRSAGCRAIYYGVETGSSRMQQIIQKRQDLAMFDHVLNATISQKMVATVSFITGYPEELLEDQEATLDVIGSCLGRPQSTLKLQLHLLTPEPGTALSLKYASALRYDGHISDFNFPTLVPDDATTVASNPTIFMNHHYYPTLLNRKRHVFVTAIFPVLYKLGFTLLQHLLTRHESRLSRFVDALYESFVNAGVGQLSPECLSDFVYSFVTRVWGKYDYVSSLVNFMQVADSILSAAAELNQRTLLIDNIGGDKNLSLSKRAAVLRATHDCPAILTALAQPEPAAMLTPELISTRNDYLLYAEDFDARTVRMFIVEPPVLAMLDDLCESRSRPDISSSGSSTLTKWASLPAFAELKRLRIIEPAILSRAES